MKHLIEQNRILCDSCHERRAIVIVEHEISNNYYCSKCAPSKKSPGPRPFLIEPEIIRTSVPAAMRAQIIFEIEQTHESEAAFIRAAIEREIERRINQRA